MAAVLVTGGAGFVGQAIVRALAERGDAVIAMDLCAPPGLEALADRRPNLAFEAAEITEWGQVMDVFARWRPDAVVHCAAIVGVVNSLSSPVSTFRVNVGGGLNVLTAMRLNGARRIINISSEEVYGPFTAPTIDETHPCFPVKPYGVSKFAFEQLARDAARAHGLSLVNLRTCWVYGPGLPRDRIPKTLVDAAVARRPLHVEKGGDFRVDQVYIDDLVQGVCLALDASDLAHDCYHIASGAAPTLAEVVDMVRDLTDWPHLSIGPGQYEFAADAEAVTKGALDISRARAELGYAPRYDIRAGLEAYIAHQRAAGARHAA